MKKSYANPEVAKVKLAAEEAVLTHCKSERVPGTTNECQRPDGQIVPVTIGS